MTPFHRIALPALVLLTLTALGTPVLVQPAGLPDEAAAPSDPAEAPPNPAQLPPSAPNTTAATTASEAPSAMPPGLEASPEGRWRIRFTGDAPGLAAPATSALVALGRRLAALPEGRVTIESQASGPVADVSVARRLSLARGLAVKQALAEGGLAATRIDIRALGRTAAAVDAADVLPPGFRRAAAPAPPRPAPAGDR